MITLERAKTVHQVEIILKDDEIFNRIAEDGHDVESYKIPFDGNQCYMLILLDEKPIGVWCLYPVNTSTLNIHCNILKEFREHGMEAGRLIVKWFAENTQYYKLNAQIPMIYPDVYHFTKKFGFTDEGIDRASICKDGQFIDQWRLGLTRDEAQGDSNGIY